MEAIPKLIISPLTSYKIYPMENNIIGVGIVNRYLPKTFNQYNNLP